MLFGVTEADKLEGYRAVKKFVKGSKTHWCTLDQDYAFVGSAKDATVTRCARR